MATKNDIFFRQTPLGKEFDMISVDSSVKSLNVAKMRELY
jgi:hypothetical protein